MGSYPSNFDATIVDKNYQSPWLIWNKLGEIRSQVLQSTCLNRRQHYCILEAIQLYTTVFLRIESNLRKYSHQNWGCIGLYADDVKDTLSAFTTSTNNIEDIPYNNSTSTSTSTSSTATNYPLWFHFTPALLGFDNSTEWARYMKSKFKPTKSTESEQKQRKSSTFQKNSMMNLRNNFIAQYKHVRNILLPLYKVGITCMWHV